MELRRLAALLAVADEGSFTAAADSLHTAQSNISEQVGQLERELGVPLLVRGRRGSVPTEFGAAVLQRARRIKAELEAMRIDLSMLQGLESGHASLGIVGTASRWIVPALVENLHARAAGVHLRVSEGASERLAADVLAHRLAQAVITEPVTSPGLVVEHLMDEALVALVPSDAKFDSGPASISQVARLPLILPPQENPLRHEVEAAATAQGVTLNVPIEVEGIRLIVDLVSAGHGASILPGTAIPPSVPGVRMIAIAHMPRRRLALVTARDQYLSLADGAVRTAIFELVAEFGRS